MGLQFPKPRARKRARFIPSLPEDAFQWILGNAAPAERLALAQIVETSHVFRLDDGTELLVTPATPQLLDRLAAFGAEAEDREWEHDDEVEVDDDTDNDNAFDGIDKFYHHGAPDDGELELDYRWPHPADRERRAAFTASEERKRAAALIETHTPDIRCRRHWLRSDGYDQVEVAKGWVRNMMPRRRP